MLVEDASLNKEDVWGLWKVPLLEVPIELSSLPTLPDHKPDTTQNESSDPDSYDKNRPMDNQVEASVHSVALVDKCIKLS